MVEINDFDVEIESGVKEKEELSDYALSFMEVESMNFYTVDTTNLGEEIVKAITNENKEKVVEKRNGEEREGALRKNSDETGMSWERYNP